MLRVRGTTYHFRRIVPPALRTALNRREIWVSLKTGYQNEAGGIEEPLVDAPGSSFWAFGDLIDGSWGSIRSAF
ncbi:MULTISPECIES: DUF6538 domain-containing protein [Acetobacter]|nr:DUF6538 domain-containing protein [Acetobacter pomorum]ATI12672.1 hypothetical protein CPF11_09570 [Acetobacter pomorum]